MRALVQDLRYGLRGLLRNPGLTAVAVISLSLGMGVNTSMFSVAKGLLLRQAPAREPDRLFTIHGIGAEGCCQETSYPDYKDLRDHNQVFSDVAAYFLLTGLSLGGGEPERVWGQLV